MSHEHRGRPGQAIAVGVIATAVLAWLSFLAAFVIFDLAGGSFGGLGAAGRNADWWAVPAWIAFTLALLALDVSLIRAVYRSRERRRRRAKIPEARP